VSRGLLAFTLQPAELEGENAMNGPDHYRHAEQLLEHAPSMLDATQGACACVAGGGGRDRA
jgi:hypothetical protein